ncbi:maleylpyruvate isomerase N-terminal domain-containing protein [Actinophytocola sp.]|uniref:maleylpyruvate isomerase N-terminal domain-containing protein n=1 Tax=Actinophytocola sp. TaxID=1872138 RepID=UPI003899AA0C
MLDSVYTLVSDTISTLGPAELQRNSRCAGWTVGDVLYHLLLDARRALVTFASPADGEPDVDEVTYWQAFQPGGDGYARHARHVRIVASAYSDGALGREWRDTAGAAVRAARACPFDLVTTQGHVLRTQHFVATLEFEALVHYLDMTVDLPGSPVPDLAPVRHVLDGLLGSTVPWDDLTYALKGTGRVPLTDDDREELGELAARFPLTG